MFVNSSAASTKEMGSLQMHSRPLPVDVLAEVDRRPTDGRSLSSCVSCDSANRSERFAVIVHDDRATQVSAAACFAPHRAPWHPARRQPARGGPADRTGSLRMFS